MVIFLAQLTVAAEPGVGALDHPAVWLDFKPALARQPLDNLQLAQLALSHPLAQRPTIGLVNPDLLQPDAALTRHRRTTPTSGTAQFAV